MDSIADFANAPSRLGLRKLDNMPPVNPRVRTGLRRHNLDGKPVEYCVGHYAPVDVVACYFRVDGSEIDPYTLVATYVRWKAQHRSYQGDPELERCDERFSGGFWITYLDVPA